MIVEIVKEDTKAYFDKKDSVKTGVSEDFLKKFEIVRMEKKHHSDGSEQYERIKQYVPTDRGIIVDMSKDCFGKTFKDQFGDDREYPTIGDLVLFIPNTSYTLDIEGKYHLVDDCKLMGFIKAEDLVDMIEESKEIEDVKDE